MGCYQRPVVWKLRADAFSYDDSIAFVLEDNQPTIVEHNPAARAAWIRIGERLLRLHYYWLYRAAQAFATSELATAIIGHPENHPANRFAYIKVLRTQLQLTEVYGLAGSVRTETGLSVDLFQALLSLDLMTAFYQ